MTRRLSGHRRDEIVIQLLDKRGFPNNHVPVLAVRQELVKSLFFFFFFKLTLL